jgi:hypothetical protein
VLPEVPLQTGRPSTGHHRLHVPLTRHRWVQPVVKLLLESQLTREACGHLWPIGHRFIGAPPLQILVWSLALLEDRSGLQDLVATSYVQSWGCEIPQACRGSTWFFSASTSLLNVELGASATDGSLSSSGAVWRCGKVSPGGLRRGAPALQFLLQSFCCILGDCHGIRCQGAGSGQGG